MNEEFLVGEKISYTIVKRFSKSVQISSKNGTFVSYISDKVAKVKAKNGRLLNVSVSGIRAEGQKGALTELIMGSSNKEQT